MTEPLHIIYTDGSAIGNGNPDAACGWAFLILEEGMETASGSGGCIGSTNNRMEMTAAIMAMRACTDKSAPSVLYSDRQYVVRTVKGEFSIKKNHDLWHELFSEKKKFSDIRFEWVRGHDKDAYNNCVDNMARKAAEDAVTA